MSADAEALALAAKALVGVPFRLHGRDPATGLDCVGLIAAALRRCGHDPVAPEGYRLRALRLGPLLGFAEANGLQPCADPLAPGDVVLVHIHQLQPHLLVAVSAGFVHAHAGLRRVVLQAGPLPWPTAARWRLVSKGSPWPPCC